MDNPDPCRDLHRPRDQRLSPGRVLIRLRILRDFPVNGAPDRHRSRCCGGWRFSAMELPVSRMSARLGGRHTGQAAHSSKPRRLSRRRGLDYFERLARPARAGAGDAGIAAAKRRTRQPDRSRRPDRRRSRPGRRPAYVARTAGLHRAGHSRNPCRARRQSDFRRARRRRRDPQSRQPRHAVRAARRADSGALRRSRQGRALPRRRRSGARQRNRRQCRHRARLWRAAPRLCAGRRRDDRLLCGSASPAPTWCCSTARCSSTTK